MREFTEEEQNDIINLKEDEKIKKKYGYEGLCYHSLYYTKLNICMLDFSVTAYEQLVNVKKISLEIHEVENPKDHMFNEDYLYGRIQKGIDMLVDDFNVDIEDINKYRKETTDEKELKALDEYEREFIEYDNKRKEYEKRLKEALNKMSEVKLSDEHKSNPEGE